MPRGAPIPHSKMTSLEQRIRALCEREGVEESVLGMQADLSSDTVGQWVRKSRDGSLPGRLEQWLKLARRYNLSLDWLLDPTPLPPGFELGKTDIELTAVGDEVAALGIDGSPDWLGVAARLAERYPHQARELVAAAARAARADKSPQTATEAVALIRLQMSSTRAPAPSGSSAARAPDAAGVGGSGKTRPGRHVRPAGKAFAEKKKNLFKTGDTDRPRTAETGDD
jgi:hypothetical protein